MTDDNSTPSPAFDTTSWIAQEQDFVQRRESIRSPNKTVLFDALAQAGITSVVVTFDGYGDSGQVEDIAAKAGDQDAQLPSVDLEIARVDWGTPEIVRVTLSVKDVIEQLAYDFLRETDCGWENCAGAYGEFIFDTTQRSITLDYNERIESSEFTQHVF